MKSLPHLTARQTQPTGSGYAVSSAQPLRRTGRLLPGAFLFASLIGVVSYASMQPTATTNQTPTHNTSTAGAASAATDSQQQLNTPVAQPSDQEDTTMKSNHSSTKVVTNNGATTVTVNGQPVVTPTNGVTNKTITDDQGNTTHINVSQGNASNSNSVVNSFSSTVTSTSTVNGGTVSDGQ